jgi:hypothetical protein
MYLTVFLSGYETKMNISMRERKEEKQSSNIRLQTQ